MGGGGGGIDTACVFCGDDEGGALCPVKRGSEGEESRLVAVAQPLLMWF